MATKLKLGTKNPIYTLAFKALVFGFFLYIYNSHLGLFWGAVLVLFSFLLYSTPLFNFLSYLPIFLTILTLSLWVGTIGGWIVALSLWLLSLSFGILLGLKNLYLTNRKYWHYFISFAMSYLLFLNFFLLDKSSLFWLKWLAVIVLLFLLFKNLLSNNVASGILALIIGELLWVVTWLPVGFLSSANLLMLSLFFIVDIIAHQRFSWKNTGLFSLLILLMLFSSYWRIG